MCSACSRSRTARSTRNERIRQFEDAAASVGEADDERAFVLGGVEHGEIVRILDDVSEMLVGVVSEREDQRVVGIVMLEGEAAERAIVDLYFRITVGRAHFE